MSTITPLEIVADDQKELLAVAAQNGLQPETTQNLQTSFAPLFTQARSIMEKSRLIEVTDVSQKLEIKLARTYRLELRAIRVASDKTRKELKEESLKKGKAIDGFHNILLHLVEAEETRLDQSEQFAERKEAERKAALKAVREELLKPFAVDCALFQLGEMTDETFDQLLSGTKLAHEAKIEAARKAEAERIEREAAIAAEQARIKAENEKLRKEAEEKEAALKAERERVAKEQAAALEAARKEREALEAIAAEERRKAEVARKEAEAKAAKDRAELEARALAEREAAEAVARKEREAREKLEAEKRAAEEQATARVKAEADALRKAAAAPDRDKLLAFATAIAAVVPPVLTTADGQAISATLKTSHEKFVKWVTEKAGAL
jgi:hypothetical protein